MRAQGYAADVAQAAAEAMEELDAAKADKEQNITATLSASGWAMDETSVEPEGDDVDESGQGDLPFPYYYDIPAKGVTTADRADVYITVDGMAAARECGFCSVTETLAGVIRVRAQLQPGADIPVECSIRKGAK
jgi:hypothetical protein